MVRVAAGALVLVAIVTQIVDDLVHHIFKPGEYFAYFTQQSSLMNVVVLLVGGVYALRFARDTTLLTTVRVAILSYAIVTGLVYNALLRGIHIPGYQGIEWPTEITHVVIPIFMVVDWILAPGAAHLQWRALWFVAIYPTAWILFTMVRGAITGWYPYPFLEPSQPGGWVAVIGYILGIAAIILGFAAVGIVISRRRAISRNRTRGAAS